MTPMLDLLFHLIESMLIRVIGGNMGKDGLVGQKRIQSNVYICVFSIDFICGQVNHAYDHID